jgi:hypothetical protein
MFHTNPTPSKRRRFCLYFQIVIVHSIPVMDHGTNEKIRQGCAGYGLISHQIGSSWNT